MLNLNVITILMKWRQLKLIHWDTNYFAQSFTSLSDPRLTVRVPPLMKIHLHDNNSEHSECSSLVRATKAANLGIKAFELDSRSTECKAHWKFLLFYFFTIILLRPDFITDVLEEVEIYIYKSNDELDRMNHEISFKIKETSRNEGFNSHTSCSIKLPF